MHSAVSSFPRLPRGIAGLGLAAALGATALPAPAQATPNFVLSFLPTTSAAEQAAFTQAANIWAGLLADSVTINLTVGTADLAGNSTLAQADSRLELYTYAATRAALVADATSSNDTTATGNLQAGPNLRLLINGTSSNPNGSGSFTPYVDSTGANTSSIRMTSANARALGLSGGTATAALGCIGTCDGSITFNTTDFPNWDLNPNDGITAGQFDFVGIAVHEIGHALGFISGVDILDINIPPANTNGPFSDNAFTYVAPLDLYRCTAVSAAQSALDLTVGSNTGTSRLFSLNGCQTSLANFATGVNFGDGRQASHWKDNQNIGIMDPTSAAGEQLAITTLDLTALDVIGWNLASNTVATPAPASALVLAFGLAGLGLARRRTLA